ncbi:brachyurin-like [Spodoptera litura]|uniref:Brachyurin-like n=1 Tax=Spodoptera litura TaxID=69820 RepID=A0A9J7ED73_SPOLT|nr:brachyurin-like [Spodoptera litura]
MKFLVALFVFGAIVHAEDVQFSEQNSAYGYIQNIGIPEAERIRKAEELGASRIIGGVPAALGQYPFQAGILGDVTVAGNPATSVCGGSLISASRVLTAAHCWFDGQVQAWRLTVVLGSVLLFSGGTRIQTSAVATHPNFSPSLARNDVAVVYFSGSVSLSANIAPVALPSGSQLFEAFVGERAIAVGFGITTNDGSIGSNQNLNHVSLSVISNSECNWAFPLVLQSSNICTSGLGSVGICGGDSGGPLVITRDNRHVLIGVTSFRHGLGCDSNMPSAYARVTSFMDFINSHI